MRNLLDVPVELRLLITSRPAPSRAEVTTRMPNPAVWEYIREELYPETPFHLRSKFDAFKCAQRYLDKGPTPASDPIQRWFNTESELRRRRPTDPLPLLLSCRQLNTETMDVLHRIPSVCSLHIAVVGDERLVPVRTAKTWTFIPPKMSRIERLEITILPRGTTKPIPGWQCVNHAHRCINLLRDNLKSKSNEAASANSAPSVQSSRSELPKIDRVNFKLLSPEADASGASARSLYHVFLGRDAYYLTQIVNRDLGHLFGLASSRDGDESDDRDESDNTKESYAWTLLNHTKSMWFYLDEEGHILAWDRMALLRKQH